MNSNLIDASMLRDCFIAGALNLDAHKAYINELNVFPVPDGDTGTNMTMTVMSAARAIDAVEEPDISNITKAMSSGALRGARGNSGVIMSQLIRGFCKTVGQAEYIDAELSVRAISKAVETAYKAVMKPKEGTILTVARGISDRVQELAPSTHDLRILFREGINYGNEVLARTPEMLPVLKEAGVVDSGGQGLVTFLEGALSVIEGKYAGEGRGFAAAGEVTGSAQAAGAVQASGGIQAAGGAGYAAGTGTAAGGSGCDGGSGLTAGAGALYGAGTAGNTGTSGAVAAAGAVNIGAAGAVNIGAAGAVGVSGAGDDGTYMDRTAAGTKAALRGHISTDDIKYGYCTEFIVNLDAPLPSERVLEFKAFLESIGDSIVCVDDDEMIKVHVHTNHPGLAFEKGLEIGSSLSRMKVDNMREEHEERLIRNASRLAAMEKQAKLEDAAGTAQKQAGPDRAAGFGHGAGTGAAADGAAYGADTASAGQVPGAGAGTGAAVEKQLDPEDAAGAAQKQAGPDRGAGAGTVAAAGASAKAPEKTAAADTGSGPRLYGIGGVVPGAASDYPGVSAAGVMAGTGACARASEENAEADAGEDVPHFGPAAGDQADVTDSARGPRKPSGFIAVCTGSGFKDIFMELGASCVIEGGQTMNPSTEDILRAIDEANAEEVFILPNNKNIILASEQAARINREVDIHVVPTKTIPQGIAAMINYTEGLSVGDNMDAMTEGIAQIKTGELTYAVRHTMIDGMDIREGDILAIGDRGILATGEVLNDTALEMIDKMVDEDSSIVTIYVGEGIDDESAGMLADEVANRYPELDVETERGEQPVYYYIISVE